ncbi:hypothetical protein ACFSC4_28195 [Deinococcus malanensis]
MSFLNERLKSPMYGTRPLASTWTPLEMDVLQGAKVPRHTADVTQITLYTFAFKAAAVRVLGDLLMAHGELLPISVPGHEYYAYHATRHPDPRDPARADDPGFSFLEERLDGMDFFQLPRNLMYFASSAFLEVYDQHELTGLTFRERWPEAQQGPTLPALRIPTK